MPQYSFTFGPNGSYFLSTPVKWTSYALPQKLRDLLFADVEAQGHSVGLGPGDEYFYGRTTPRRGDTWNTMSGENGDTIVKWLNARTAAGDAKISLCYGPGQSWIGCTSKGAASWGGLPDSFDAHIRGFHPVMATLGVDNSYVLVSGDGAVRWNLMNKYDSLGQILRNASTAIEMVALNPYIEGQYIILFKNGTYRALVPVLYKDTIAGAINDAQKHAAEINAIVCQSMLDNSKLMNNFVMNMAWNM